MLPLVIALEICAEAAAVLGEGRQAVAGLRDVEVKDAMRFFADRPLTARISAEATDAGILCRLTSQAQNRDGQLIQAERLHVTATVDLSDGTPAEMPAAWPPPLWYDVQYPDEAPVIYHGPPFRCLHKANLSEAGGWGRLTAPPMGELVSGRLAEGLLVPAAMIDAALFACGVCVWLQSDHGVAIPHGLNRLRLGRPPQAGEDCLARFLRLRGPQDRATFDFTLFGGDDRMIAHVEGYQAVMVPGATIRAAGLPNPTTSTS